MQSKLLRLDSGITWKLRQFLEFIEETPVIPRVDRAKVHSIATGIDRNLAIFLYHTQTAKEAIDSQQLGARPLDQEGAKLFLRDSPMQREWDLAMLTNEANTLAAIHSVRANFEYLAQLVRWVYPLPQLSERNCSLWHVCRALPSSALKDAMTEVIDMDSYQYVRHFVNVIKHRRLIRHQATVDLTQDQFGVQVLGFKSSDEKSVFPSYWARELLEILHAPRNSIVLLGQLLLDHCIHTANSA